jgi:hypothetical protein
MAVALEAPDDHLCYPRVAHVDSGVLMLKNVLAPVITGVVLASISLFGLVSAQTSAPAKNPASQAIITYGDR